MTTPSKEWQNRVLHKIHALDGYKEKSTNFNILFNPFYMKKLLSGVLAMMVVVVIGGYFYTQNTPYAQAMKHLNNASTALEQLKNPGTVQKDAFVPTAYAEVSDETTTVGLIQTVENETDEAVNASEGITDPEDSAEILGEVDNVQTETVEVLEPLIASSQSDAVIKAATSTVENTDESNGVVETARNKAEKAAAKNEKEVQIKLKEEITARREARQAEKTAKVEDLLSTLKVNYSDMSDSMKKKYDAIQQILTDCKATETDKTKCNIGRAKGLAVALNAKARNEVRQEERKNQLEELKTLREKNKDEMEAQKEETKKLREENKDEMEKQREETKDLKETDDNEEALAKQKEETKQLKEQNKDEMKAQKEETKKLREENKEEKKQLIETLKEDKTED